MNIRKHVKTINVFALLFFLLIGYSSYVKYEGAKLKDENKTLEKQLDIANEKIKEQKNELDELRNLLDSQKDVDYEIEVNETDSNVTVVAIHGGKIEKGTTELAYALASHNNYNYYSFQGLKSTDNFALHVPSDKFAETYALEMVSKSKRTLSIHGCGGAEEFTYIGGRDTELANRIKESLTKYGFTVKKDTPKDLAGISPDNIVNRDIDERGVQLEISEGLRTKFLSTNKDSLKSYVLAISEAVNNM
ncbi:poly-gamma-glutamate hydrolase family protein [Desulfoscipio gibsoniae]|uniref:Phage-related replication protein n=1 Tax=Desulfoscipio gibsoniae DSM 7213 TaxID=767817 RepID=R4KJG9_9FIRM|nr:poly-gamma-glutamate hydrolase family protein [Desulfoscipio gibsoniae]AGL01762.1 phage-related replication protein [Desulfoscipio gibsoniae DSM 7213]